LKRNVYDWNERERSRQLEPQQDDKKTIRHFDSSPMDRSSPLDDSVRGVRHHFMDNSLHSVKAVA